MIDFTGQKQSFTGQSYGSRLWARQFGSRVFINKIVGVAFPSVKERLSDMDKFLSYRCGTKVITFVVVYKDARPSFDGEVSDFAGL